MSATSSEEHESLKSSSRDFEVARGIKRMTTGRELIEGYAGWWKGWSWDWFVTLTYAGFPWRSTALRKFQKWIADLQKEQGTSEFRFVRVIETGAFGNNVHVHLLVGGLKEKARLFPGEWRDRWEKIAGRAAIVRFDPEKGGVYYVLKTLDPARDFDVDFYFPTLREKEPSREPVGTEQSVSGRSMAGSRKRRRSMKIYRGIVSLKRTTTGTVIYGNHDLRGQYIPKELLQTVSGSDGEYPAELVFIIRTTAKNSVKVPRGIPKTTQRTSANRSK